MPQRGTGCSLISGLLRAGPQPAGPDGIRQERPHLGHVLFRHTPVFRFAFLRSDLSCHHSVINLSNLSVHRYSVQGMFTTPASHSRSLSDTPDRAPELPTRCVPSCGPPHRCHVGRPSCFESLVCHAVGALAWYITDRAPWISSMRKYGSPRFEIDPNRILPPVPLCRGTNPRNEANSRPDLNVLASPTVATSAVAVSRPMPGTAAIARHAASCFCQAPIRFSREIDIALQFIDTSELVLQATHHRCPVALPRAPPCGLGSQPTQQHGLLETSPPNSYNNPRSWFTCMVRIFTSKARIRCRPSIAC